MVKVLHAGFYTSIQDTGRVGYQHYGVPVSGTMDARAAILANTLLGNTADAAVLEITMSGPKLQFEVNTAIAITGANISPMLNDKRIINNHRINIEKGDILSFGKLVSGFRSYLSVFEGFQTDAIFGSRSMYQGITKSRTIKKGDTLQIQQIRKANTKHFASLKIDDVYLNTSTLGVFKGPEFDKLPITKQEQLFKQTFTVAKENNRMAYQFEEAIANTLDAIITAPVTVGTVQLTPSGKLIALMKDCQTTGGYPRVLQLSEAAIHILAQKITGSSLRFKL